MLLRLGGARYNDHVEVLISFNFPLYMDGTALVGLKKTRPSHIGMGRAQTRGQVGVSGTWGNLTRP